MLSRDIKPTLTDVKISQPEWKKSLDIFEDAYKKECEFYDHINKIVLLAKEEGDELTREFMLKMLDD